VVLLVRSIGFKSKALNVPATQNTVQFRLAKDNFRLEAVVVTGRGNGRRTEEECRERRGYSERGPTVSTPTASIETALQGSSPVPTSVRTTGHPAVATSSACAA
jgi:hypothetical protein